MGAWDKIKSGVGDLTPGFSAPMDTIGGIYSGGASGGLGGALKGGASSAFGDAKHGLDSGLLGGIVNGPENLYNHFFTGPANEQKAALDAAMATSNQSNQDMMKYYGDQQAQARSYYKPLQDMFTASYGTGGMQAPQAPKSPGTPLTNMYAGSK